MHQTLYLIKKIFGGIASYFLENVMFMSKNGFITGFSAIPKGTFTFNPKGTCTCEMAVIIATRVYEKYAGIAVTP